MKKRHITFITLIIIIISLLLLLLLLLLFFTTSVKSQDIGIESLRKTSKAFSSMARSVSPSVVFIQVEGTKLRSSYDQFQMLFRDDVFEHFFGERFGGFLYLNHHYFKLI
jgi:serine protease Do